MELVDLFILICVYIILMLISTIGRELFVGLVAIRFGDNTPLKQDRITLNPLKHIEIFGSFIIPIVMAINGTFFGYAKPMAIKFPNIQERSGIKGCLYVSLAGTFFSFFSAFFIFLILKIGAKYGLVGEAISNILLTLSAINVMLGIIHLIPIAPLDGAKILAFIGIMLGTSIFARWYQRLEKYGIIIVVLVLIIPQTKSIISMATRAVIAIFDLV